jgi:hypothetical protein
MKAIGNSRSSALLALFDKDLVIILIDEIQVDL